MSAVRAKMTRALRKPCRRIGLNSRVRVREIARAFQKAAAQRKTVAQGGRGGFAAAKRPKDQRRAERPEKGWRPDSAPSQMMHEIERTLLMQRTSHLQGLVLP